MKLVVRILILSLVYVFFSNFTVYAGIPDDYRVIPAYYSRPISKFQIKVLDSAGSIKSSAISSETRIIGQDIPALNAVAGDKLVIEDLSYSRAGYIIDGWDFQYYSEQETSYRSNLASKKEITLVQACTWEFYLCVKDSAPMVNGIENWSDNGNHRSVGRITEDFPDGLYWYFTKIVVNVSASSGPQPPEPPQPSQYEIAADFSMVHDADEGSVVSAVNVSFIDGISYTAFTQSNPSVSVSHSWSISGPGSYNIVDDSMDRFVFSADPGIYTVTLVMNVGSSMGCASKTLNVISLPRAKITCYGQMKVNRKITLSCNESTARSEFPINHSLDSWQIEYGSINVIDDAAYVVKRDYDTSTGTWELMFKQPGTYKILLTITDTRGKSAADARSITIINDSPPVAGIEVPSNILRNPSDANNAVIRAYDRSYSVDGDIVGNRKWEAAYDSDNDGNFEDETYVVIDNSHDYTNCTYKKNKVGKLSIRLTVYDVLNSQNTLEEFLTPNDYKSSTEVKTVEIGNVSPNVSFSVSPLLKADIRFLVNANDNLQGVRDNTAALISKLYSNNIDANVEVYPHKPELDYMVQWDGRSRNSSGIYDLYSKWGQTGFLIGDKSQYYSKYNISDYPHVHCYDENFNYLWTYSPPTNKTNIEVSTNPAVDGVYVLYCDLSNKYQYVKINKTGSVAWTVPATVPLSSEPFWNDLVVDKNGNIISPQGITSQGEYFIPPSADGASFPYTLQNLEGKIYNERASYFTKNGKNYCIATGNYGSGKPIMQLFRQDVGYLNSIDFPSSSYDNLGWRIYENTLAVIRHYKNSSTQKTTILYYDLTTGMYQSVYTLFSFKNSTYQWVYNCPVALHDDGRYIFFYNHQYTPFLWDLREKTVTNMYGVASFPSDLFFSHDFTRINSLVTYRDNGIVYSNIISKPVIKSYIDIIPTLAYRENAYIFNVLINSGPMNAEFSEIEALLSDSKGKFVFMGSNENGKNIADASGGRIYPYTSDMPGFINELADYISEKIYGEEKVKPQGTVLVNQQINIDDRRYSDYENDPADVPERWKYVHYPSYYENNNGIASFNNQVLSVPVLTFDKVGKYVVTYRKRDNPTDGDGRFDSYKKWSADIPNYTLYVHRTPVAKFNVISGTTENITISNLSYDPDRQSLGLAGIKTTEIRYRSNADGSKWCTAYNVTAIPTGQPGDYIIGMRVQDLDGAWSDYAYDTIDIAGPVQPEAIVLDFNIPNEVKVHENISPVEYTAYTTYGNSVVRTWHYHNGSAWVSIDAGRFEAGEYCFDNPGIYPIRLTGIYNSLSSSVIRSVTVNPTFMNISAMIIPNPVPAGEEITLIAYTSGDDIPETVSVKFNEAIIGSGNTLADSAVLTPYPGKSVWARAVKIGKSVKDTDMVGHNYSATFTASDVYGGTEEAVYDLQVNTPINLRAGINGRESSCELLPGLENTFYATTSKYVSELRINFSGKTYSSEDTDPWFEVLQEGDIKTWVLKLFIDDGFAIDEDTAEVKFTAVIPSGKQESITLEAAVPGIMAENFTITLINNIDWRGYYFDLNRPVHSEGVLVRYEMKDGTEIKTDRMPINTSPGGLHFIDCGISGVKSGTQVKGYIKIKGNPDSAGFMVKYHDKDNTPTSVYVPAVHVGGNKYNFTWIIPLDAMEGSFVEFELKAEKSTRVYGNEKWLDTWRDGCGFKVFYVEGNVLRDDILFNQSN